MKTYILHIVLFFCSLTGFSQTTATVDVLANNQPDITYKRGIAAPGMGGFFDSQKMHDFLDYQSSIGMGIFNGIRNLFKDPETNEFYYENGEYKNRQIAEFTTIRKYTEIKGFELISQVGGTPRNSNYEFDSSFYKVLPWGPHSDFAPIPAEGESMQAFQENFAEWAINADKAIGPNFHSIWIGTQEIAHTIGFQGGNANSTAANKNLNIRRWVDYWKPINDQLRAAGAKTGGLQLNWSNKNIYDYAVDYMIQKDLHVDYLTYQFYQWGDNRALDSAIVALDSYNKVYPGTKIIIDRGAYDKILPNGVSAGEDAQGAIYWLVGELGCMNYADKIYAHTLDRQVNGMDTDKDNLLWKTKEWVNTIGRKRCGLTGLPNNVDGFVTSTNNKVSAAIWNRSNTSQQINLKITNADFATGTTLTVKHASGSSFTTSSATWNAATNTIEGITLGKFDYVLIDIESPEPLVFRQVKSTDISIFPNPTNNMVHVSGADNIFSMSLISYDGSILNQTNSTSMDVSNIGQGCYLLNIKTNTGEHIYKKLFIQ